MVTQLVANDAFLQQRHHPFAVFERKPQFSRAVERWPLDAQDLGCCELPSPSTPSILTLQRTSSLLSLR
jgi:hypothetical protein